MFISSRILFAVFIVWFVVVSVISGMSILVFIVCVSVPVVGSLNSPSLFIGWVIVSSVGSWYSVGVLDTSSWAVFRDIIDPAVLVVLPMKKSIDVVPCGTVPVSVRSFHVLSQGADAVPISTYSPVI